RNPLSLALISLGMAQKFSSRVDQVLKYTQKSKEAMERIDKMISDLLDSRRLDAGNPLNMNFEEFDLVELLQQVVNDFSSTHGNRFVLHSPAGLTVFLCKKNMRRAVENLVSNAVKYGSPETKIDIGL